MYFKIMFQRKNTLTRKLLISEIIFSFFRNFEFEYFHKKILHYVYVLLHFETLIERVNDTGYG